MVRGVLQVLRHRRSGSLGVWACVGVCGVECARWVSSLTRQGGSCCKDRLLLTEGGREVRQTRRTGRLAGRAALSREPEVQRDCRSLNLSYCIISYGSIFGDGYFIHSTRVAKGCNCSRMGTLCVEAFTSSSSSSALYLRVSNLPKPPRCPYACDPTLRQPLFMFC